MGRPAIEHPDLPDRHRALCTLEVVNERGTSIVWDDPFASDRDADAAFRDTLAREGIEAFLDTE